MRWMLMTWLAAAALFLGGTEGAQAQARPDAEAETARDAGSMGNRPAARVTGARVLAVGVFSSTVTARVHSDGVADGRADRARGFKLLRRGNVVTAQLGTGIGLRYRVEGSPRGATVLVDVVVRHPDMVNPDTQLPMNVSSAQYERRVGETAHSVWSFDTPGSMVPGEYVIEILHGRRVLIRQAFKVLEGPKR